MKKKPETAKKEIVPIKYIYVFGVGAAGSQILLNLIYTQPALDFTVIDYDVVENRNIEPGTQPYGRGDLNRPKTQAISRIALSIKNKKINIQNKKITSAKDISDIVKNPKESVIIDAFDNADSRNFFTKLSKEFSVMHVGFSAQMSGEAVWEDVFSPMEHSKADAEIDICEMSIARPFIMGLTGNAAIIVDDYIRKGIKTNIYYDRHHNIKKY